MGGPCLIGQQQVDITWTLSIKYLVLYKGPSYVQYIRWTLSIEYEVLNKVSSYVHGCGLVGPWLIGLQRVNIRWTLSIKCVVLYKGPSYVQYIRWTLIVYGSVEMYDT